MSSSTTHSVLLEIAHEDPIKDRRPVLEIINETDTFSETLSCFLKDEKEDEFINFMENLKSDEETRPNLNCIIQGYYNYLQYACVKGLDKVAKYLIDTGANLNATGFEYIETPVILAGRFERFHLVQYIIEKDRSQLFSKFRKRNILHAVIVKYLDANDGSINCFKFVMGKLRELHDNDVLSIIVNEEDENGETALGYAVRTANRIVIADLLESGADFYKKNSNGNCLFLNMNPNILEEYLNTRVISNYRDGEAIEFNYKFLVPPEGFNDDNTYAETNRLLDLSRSSDFYHLIQHPVISSFIHLKWHRVKWMFFYNLALYSIFCLLLTLYILAFQDNTVLLAGQPRTFIAIAVGVCIAMIAVREAFQLVISPLDYLRQPENMIDVSVILVTVLILVDTPIMKKQISAIVIFLAWTELVLLLGRHPTFSVKVEMYKRVTFNFVKFLSCYSIVFVAFALSFYILSSDSNPEGSGMFSNVTTTLFDTIFRAGDIGHGDIDTLFERYPFVGRILILLFLLFISFVLLNLLNGLAVSDTQAIMDEAELYGLISRLNLISSIETTARFTMRLRMLLRMKIFKTSILHVLSSDGNMTVLGSNIGAAALRGAIKILNESQEETIEGKLKTLVVRIDNVNKAQGSSDKNFILVINKLETLLDRIECIERLLETNATHNK